MNGGLGASEKDWIAALDREVEVEIHTPRRKKLSAAPLMHRGP